MSFVSTVLLILLSVLPLLLLLLLMLLLLLIDGPGHLSYHAPPRCPTLLSLGNYQRLYVGYIWIRVIHELNRAGFFVFFFVSFRMYFICKGKERTNKDWVSQKDITVVEVTVRVSGTVVGIASIIIRGI